MKQWSGNQEAAFFLLENEFKKRRARNRRFSLRAYASLIGISQSQLSLILNQKRKIGFQLAIRLAQLFTEDIHSFEEITGFPLSDLVKSGGLIVVSQYQQHQGDVRKLPDADRTHLLLSGTVIDAAEWPRFSALIDRMLSESPTASVAIRILK